MDVLADEQVISKDDAEYIGYPEVEHHQVNMDTYAHDTPLYQ